MASAFNRDGLMSAPAIGPRPRFAPNASAVIDWSHPLSQGLLFCLRPIDARVVDLVSGRLLTVQASAQTGASPLGSGLSSTAATSGAFLPLTSASAYPLTFTWAGQSLAPVGNDAGMLAFVYGGSGLISGGETAPYLYGIGRRAAAFTFSSVSSSSYLGEGTWATTASASVVTLTMEANSQSLYADGARVATSSFSLASAPTSSNLVGLCLSTYTALGRAPNATSTLGLVHNRVLSANEIAALRADPFQILRQ